MAKKKRAKKRTLSKPKTTATPKAIDSAPPQVAAATTGVYQPKEPARTEATRADYVKADVRKIVILATLFILLELALSFAFSHTGLGEAVYNRIQF